MPARNASRSPRRLRFWRLAALLILATVLGGAATTSWAYWTGIDDLVRGPGAAGAASVDGGAAPTVSSVGAASIVVSWGATTLSNGTAVGGYVVKRYLVGTTDLQTMGAGCTGTIVTRSCTESGVPTGEWQYTVTPVVGGNWRGAESSTSGEITTGPATLKLDQSLFGPPLPAVITGTVSGLQANEDITYLLDDGSGVVGSPTKVGADGKATITSLTIATAADGPHTIDVVGASSGKFASAPILIDTTPAKMTAVVTPPPNAAGWNRTPVEVSGVADDGNGSGLSFVKVTLDGSDPRTSPTAFFYYGDPVTHDESVTIKFYGVDFAGNVTPVQTLQLKIDMDAPMLTAEVTDVTGGAYLPWPGTAVYYRGVDAGSFRFGGTVIDDEEEDFTEGVSVGTSELTSVTVGFTHVPSITTGLEGEYLVTNPFTWVAGTTSTPTGRVTITDEAGNTTVFAGAIHNDSTAPAGGSVDALGLDGTGGRYSNSTTLNLALSRGGDAGSGLADSGAHLLRASAPLDSSDGVLSGVCGAWGAATPVADDPSTAFNDTVPADGRCYRYTYTVPDHVGNLATFTSPDIKVQTAAHPELRPSAANIVPLTGVGAQYVSGSTVYYKPSQTGSFWVATSVRDFTSGVVSVDFPALAGFSGGATKVEGDGTFTTTYTWSNNTASPSPGSQVISATDNAGLSLSRAEAFMVVRDAAAPVHSLELSGASGAYLNGASLFYKPNASGAFKLVDTVTDDGSGAASVTYPAINLSGWTHGAETVWTPFGGPFTSSTFSWSSYPSSPSTYKVTGQDSLGTTSTTQFTFVADQSPPSGGSIVYANGIRKTPSVPITTADGTDSASGIDAAAGAIKRDVASLNTATDACGSFPGTYPTTVTLVDGADTSVSNAHCYQYRYIASDNVGNTRTYTAGSNVVKLDTAPKVKLITSKQSGGGAGDGRLQVGDQLILSFDEDLAPASVPTTFSGAKEARASSGTVKLTIAGITAGAVDTGSSAYLAGSGVATATFAGSAVLANNGAATTLTLTVTSLTGSTTASAIGTLSFVTATTITGADGTAAIGTYTVNNFKLF